MNNPLRLRTMRRSVAALLVASIACTLAPPPANAAGAVPVFNPLQTSTIGAITIDPPKAPSASADIIRVGTKIPHVDFDLIDPVTKAHVTRDTPIKVPSGSTEPAGYYYDGLNALETDLNNHGQSLRTGAKSYDVGTHVGATEAEFEASIKRSPETPGRYVATSGSDILHQTIVKSANAPVENVPDTVVNTAPTNPPTQGKNMALLKLVPDSPYGFKDLGWAPISPAPPPVAPGTPHLSKTYSEIEGQKSLAAIALNTAATAEPGDGNVGHVILSEGLTGYLFGQGKNVLSATADATPKSATLEMSGNGDTFMNYKGPAIAAPLGSKHIDLFDVYLPIDVSCFTLTLEAKGGVDFLAFASATAHDSYINATLLPNVSVNGSFSLSFGVGWTGGSYGFGLAIGIQGNFNIASISMPLSASAGEPLTMLRSGTYSKVGANYKTIYGCHLTFDGMIDSELNYSFLSGSISVFVKGCFIFCDTLFSVKVIGPWKGITGQDTAFHETERASASVFYSDLAEYGVVDPGTAFSKDDSSGMPAACDDLLKGQLQNGAFEK